MGLKSHPKRRSATRPRAASPAMYPPGLCPIGPVVRESAVRRRNIFQLDLGITSDKSIPQLCSPSVAKSSTQFVCSADHFSFLLFLSNLSNKLRCRPYEMNYPRPSHTLWSLTPKKRDQWLRKQCFDSRNLSPRLKNFVSKEFWSYLFCVPGLTVETRGTLCADENGMVFNDTKDASACDSDKFPNLERECESQEEEVSAQYGSNKLVHKKSFNTMLETLDACSLYNSFLDESLLR